MLLIQNPLHPNEFIPTPPKTTKPLPPEIGTWTSEHTNWEKGCRKANQSIWILSQTTPTMVYGEHTPSPYHTVLSTLGKLIFPSLTQKTHAHTYLHQLRANLDKVLNFRSDYGPHRPTTDHNLPPAPTDREVHSRQNPKYSSISNYFMPSKVANCGALCAKLGQPRRVERSFEMGKWN